MASVTQKIPNYVLGISTQPDEKKIPGQVVELKNAIPDVVKQLRKRPGSHLVAKLTAETSDDTKWFSIYTDVSEQYIGQCSPSGTVKIWRCSDGVEIPVDYAPVPGTGKATYLDNQALSDEKSSDIQIQTINETTFFVNRRKNTAMLSSVGDLSPARLNEAYIELDTISYGKQYALDIYDPNNNTTYTYTRATGIAVDDSVGFGGASSPAAELGDGSCEGMGREYVFAETGTDKFGSSPPSMSQNGKTNLRYEMDTRCTPQPKNTSGTVEGDDYYDAYAPFAKLQFGGEGWTTNDTHSYTSKKGLTTTVTITSHVNVTSRGNVALIRPSPTSSNSEEHVSAAGILGDLKATIDAISGHGITATIVGNGIHLYRATPFGVTSPERNLMNVITSEANNIADLPRTCRHGYVVRIVNSGEDMDDYYLRFQAEGITADISKSCTYSRAGATVTVTDTAHGLANGDQVYIDFTSGGAGDGLYEVSDSQTNTFVLVSNSSSGTISAGATCTYTPARYGEGVWEEVAAPGLEVTIDKDTMPLRLTRVEPGTYSINGESATNHTNGCFQFGYPDWGVRDVGDDVTNPTPSFIGNPIQKLAFYRNRIAILSQENVILSRVNNFYNFWVKTAMAISNADPIDLQSSSTFPTKLYDAVEHNSGLVLLSASEQFICNSGAEALLTPETAKISYLSSYAFNPDTRPFSLGTTIGFLNSTARNARFYEMGGIRGGQEPTVEEQSKIISNLFPTNTTLPTESTENDMILFAVDGSLHTATDTVYGYKFYTQGDKRVQSAWFKWTMPNVIAYHSIMDDIYYVVLKNGGNFTLERLDLKLNENTLMIGTTPDENRIHLDTKQTIQSANITYNANADTSTFSLGAGYYSSNTLTAYIATDSDNAGKSHDIVSSEISGTGDNKTITLSGNWKTSTKDGSSVNTDVIIGYEYEMEMQIPKIYMSQTSGDKINTDTRGSLIVHRLNFAFGDVGVIDVTLKRRGRDDYTNTYESIEWDNYKTDEKSIADDYIHTIPVYERNTNLDVILKSNHPSPASIHSMNWEGAYSPRYYKRV